MATAIPLPNWQTSADGATLASGAKIYFWVPGTSTPRTPFSDTALTVPTSNPVILNASGWPETNIYLSSELAYEYEVKSADDATTYKARTLIPANATGGVSASSVLSVLSRNTYAELTAITAANRFDEMLVYVAGRAAQGDGADGWWRFDSASAATANAGTILAPDAGTGRWLRQFEDGRYNVRWFGAKGDNATNDDAAVAAAIAAIPTTGTFPGGVLYFPRGHYRLSQTLTLPDYTTLEGDGHTTTRLDFQDQTSGVGVASDGVPAVNPSFFIGVRDIMIENAYSLNSQTGDGLNISGAAYMVSVENFWARGNAGYGVNNDGFTTSIYLQNVHPLENQLSGVRINNAVYAKLDTVGSDQSQTGYGYIFRNVACVTMDACAAETNEKAAIRLEASTAIAGEAGTLYGDVHELTITGFFSFQNGQDTTSPGFIESSSLNSREIDITIIDCLDDNPVSGVSVVANGETRIIRQGGVLEGTYTLNDNAYLWAEHTRATPAYGRRYSGGNHDLYINSVIAHRVNSNGHTFRGALTNAYGWVFAGTTDANQEIGLWFIPGNTGVNARSWGMGFNRIEPGDMAFTQGTSQGANPVSGNTRLHIRADGKVGIGTTAASEMLHVSGNARVSGHYKVGANQVVGAQGAAIADVATGGSATAAANATAINSILARLRAHGLIAT